MEISLEEKKAIEFFKLQSGHWKDFMRKKGEKTIEDIIINLIEKQQKEIEKKDRQIDLMAEKMAALCTGLAVIREQFEKQYCDFVNDEKADCCWKTDTKCSQCIKQYFKNKAEEN